MIQIRARKRDYNDSIGLLVCEKGAVGRRFTAVAEPFVMRQLSPNDIVRDPTIELETTAAQALMDELWNCGLRPIEGSGSAGSLAATERHLEDMRKVAFRLLDENFKPVENVCSDRPAWIDKQYVPERKMSAGKLF